MILVYTPGRVGTCAIQDTLKRDTDEHIVSLHSFTPNESLDGLPDDNVEVEKGKIFTILKEISWNRKVRAITVVRDPIERAISSFSFFRHHYPKTNYGEKDCFLTQFNHDWYLNWFNNEPKAFFGIDVYEEQWPACNYKNWMIYSGTAMSLIVVKFPHFNILREVMDVMWNMKIGNIIRNNMIGCKPDRVAGYMELKNSKFNKHFVNHMYDSKLVQHFWSPEEIEKLKEKWRE